MGNRLDWKCGNKINGSLYIMVKGITTIVCKLYFVEVFHDCSPTMYVIIYKVNGV